MTLFSKYIYIVSHQQHHPGDDCQSLWNLQLTLSHVAHIVNFAGLRLEMDMKRLVAAEDVSLLEERYPPAGL